jgi:hypothetical protein
MAFEISIKDDLKDLTRKLSKIERKQIPFATSQGLNDTAFMATRDLKEKAPGTLNNPTPFTLRGFKFRKSNKRELVAAVYIAAIQAKYLTPQIKGGVIRPSGGARHIAVPVNIRLNKYGNIPGRKGGIVKGKANRFVATINGVSGIWERKGRRGSQTIVLLASFKKEVQYKKRFPFNLIVNASVQKHFSRNFDKRLTTALRFAR